MRDGSGILTVMLSLSKHKTVRYSGQPGPQPAEGHAPLDKLRSTPFDCAQGDSRKAQGDIKLTYEEDEAY